MCRRRRGPPSTSRSRRPGTLWSSSTMTSPTVAPSTSWRRAVPGKSATSDPGSITVAMGSPFDDGRLDAPDLGQHVRDHPPRVAAVRAVPQLAGGGPERHPDRVEDVSGHRLAVDGQEGVLLRQAVVRTDPRLAAI